MKLGVFDSGDGGRSVAEAIRKAFPDYEIVLREDLAHMPYGDKPADEVFGYVLPILQQLVIDGCELIVVACNTVTTTLIDRLRVRLDVPLVGIEPMVKPAALLTKSGIIAVCATPATLGSARYRWLKDTYAKGKTVIEPDCSNWARMIEYNAVNENQIKQQMREVVEAGADVVVLGCTHYHWIEETIKRIVGPGVAVLQPEQAVLEQLKERLPRT